MQNWGSQSKFFLVLPRYQLRKCHLAFVSFNESSVHSEGSQWIADEASAFSRITGFKTLKPNCLGKFFDGFFPHVLPIKVKSLSSYEKLSFLLRTVYYSNYYCLWILKCC